VAPHAEYGQGDIGFAKFAVLHGYIFSNVMIQNCFKTPDQASGRPPTGREGIILSGSAGLPAGAGSGLETVAIV